MPGEVGAAQQAAHAAPCVTAALPTHAQPHGACCTSPRPTCDAPHVDGRYDVEAGRHYVRLYAAVQRGAHGGEVGHVVEGHGGLGGGGGEGRRTASTAQHDDDGGWCIGVDALYNTTRALLKGQQTAQLP